MNTDNSSNACNAEEATHAKAEGKKHLQSGNFLKAIRLFEISLRLDNNPDVGQLLASAKAAAAREKHNRTQDNRQEEAPPPDDIWNMVYDNSIARWILGIESRLISSSAKGYVRGMVAIILALLFWKDILRSSLSLGFLPGDINMSVPGMSFHMPIVSCLLMSFLGNALLRAFNR